MHDIINKSTIAANHPNISASVMKYGANDIIVLLRRTSEKAVTYNVSAEPETATMNVIAKSSVQLTVLYNTHYYVSIEATSCGQNRFSTAVEIYYGELLHI